MNKRIFWTVFILFEIVITITLCYCCNNYPEWKYEQEAKQREEYYKLLRVIKEL